MLAHLGKNVLDFFGEQSKYIDPPLENIYKTLSQHHKISDLLPYQSFDPKHNLFFNVSGCGFVLEIPGLVGASEEMQKEISNLFERILPENSRLQVILWADPYIGRLCQKWSLARKPGELQNLSLKRAQFLEKMAFNSPYKPYVLRNFRCFLAYSQEDVGEDPMQLAAILQLQQQLTVSLEMLGLPVMIWRPEDLLNTISGIIDLDPSTTRPLERRWDPCNLLAEQFRAPQSRLVVEPKGLGIGAHDVRVRTYQVVQAPAYWALHAMGKLIGDEERDQGQIPCPFIIHYGVYIPRQEKLKTKILAKTTYVERQVHSPLGKYLPRLQEEAEELGFVRQALARGARVVQTAFNVILLAPEKLLPTAEQILFNLYVSREWHVCANDRLHLPIFLSSLPMMWGEKWVQGLLNCAKLKTTISTESANMLPIQAEWRGTSTPGMVLGGRRGQYMTWDPFDNNAGNYNVAVVGRSGSGKSVFMQEMITTTLGLGGRVFVFDVGRSFAKTCVFLKGQFVEFKTRSPICLNPFSSIPIDDVEAAHDALAMIKSTITLMAAPTCGLDDLSVSLLEQVMLDVWGLYKQDTTVSLIAKKLLEHKEQKARDLGTMLFPYTAKGIYGRFFEGRASVNLKNALVVVELEELKERKDLQGVVVQTMIVNITNQMFLGDRQTPFNIVFDEAWDLLRGVQSGPFIETLARRLRKYYGSLVVGTQSVNDFYINPGAQAAFDNSDWMCLLSQKAESIEQLKKTNRISLTPHMEEQLKSVKTKQGEYAEVMICGPSGYAIGRLLLDPYSQLLYSTKPQDYASVETLLQQGLSLEQALDRVLQEKAQPCKS